LKTRRNDEKKDIYGDNGSEYQVEKKQAEAARILRGQKNQVIKMKTSGVNQI